MSIKGKAYIVGAYEHPLRKAPNHSVAQLHAEVAKALLRPDVREHLASDGAEPGGTRPDAFATFIKAELDKWSRVVRDAKLSLN